MRSPFLCFKGIRFTILLSNNKYAKSKPDDIIKDITVIAGSEFIFLNPVNANSKINGSKINETIRILINFGTFVLSISRPTNSKNSTTKNSITISKMTPNFAVTSLINYILSGQSILSISRIFFSTILTARHRLSLAC